MSSRDTVLVCEVQRFSLHDGPGIRTTIFFKGCPLSCLWCHNPESIDFGNEIMYSAADCIQCGDCVAACPEQALALDNGVVVVDHDRCRSCLRCAEVCPSGARVPAARAHSVEELLAEVRRDQDFYGSDGGITLSGGEPLVHTAFLLPFLQRAKELGLHVVAETAGHWHFDRVEPMLRHIDLLLFDIKVVDEQRHRLLTGKSNRRIQENLRRLVDRGQPLQVRMPLVPGLNDTAGDIGAAAQLLRSLHLDSIVLLPYHPWGQGKLAKLSRAREPLNVREPTPDELARVGTVFTTNGISVVTS